MKPTNTTIQIQVSHSGIHRVERKACTHAASSGCMLPSAQTHVAVSRHKVRLSTCKPPNPRTSNGSSAKKEHAHFQTRVFALLSTSLNQPHFEPGHAIANWMGRMRPRQRDPLMSGRETKLNDYLLRSVRELSGNLALLDTVALT